jgi:prepilin-type processing-associated H-X9-DG protein
VAIVLRCECGNEFQTPDENLGRPARCPVCHRELVLPHSKLPLDGELADFHDDRPSRTSAKAIASLSLGLCPLVASLITGQPAIFFLAWCVTGVPAIVFGLLGSRDINNPRKRVKGGGMARTGIVLGALTTIMVVLMGLFSESREAPRRAMCTNNLKQIALAMHHYESAFGSFPPAAGYDKDGNPLLSWRVLLLPYLEEDGLYEQFHLDEAWDSPNNKPLGDRMPRVFQCPSGDLSQGLTTYEVVVDPHSMFTGKPTGVPFSSVIDGTSKTLLVVEGASPVPWTEPSDLSLASSKPSLGMGSKHPGGFNAVMADGSVHFQSTEGNDAISPQDLRALVTRDGQEAIDAP